MSDRHKQHEIPTVIYVDEDSSARFLAKISFEARGYEPILVESPEQAIASIEKRNGRVNCVFIAVNFRRPAETQKAKESIQMLFPDVRVFLISVSKRELKKKTGLKMFCKTSLLYPDRAERLLKRIIPQGA